MVDRKNLRIGNIVKSTVFDKMVFVEEIHKLFIETNYSPIGYLEYDKIDPIPISEEILMKAGFDKSMLDNRFVIWKKDDINWLHSNYELFYWDTNVKHLHQLQNLYFALTGEELDVSKLI